MKFPSIANVANDLRAINQNVESDDEHGCDVRPQVYLDGQYIVRAGDAQYDQDHRGFWGASTIPGVVKGKVRRFDSRAIARDLIEQCREAYADSPHLEAM
jgi:hypothetical protein